MNQWRFEIKVCKISKYVLGGELEVLEDDKEFTTVQIFQFI